MKTSDKVLFIASETLPVLGILALAVCVAVGQDKNAKPASIPPGAGVAFSELAQARVLIAYHKALEAQTNKNLADQEFTTQAANYQKVCSSESKAIGLPDGTTCNVNTTADSATPVPPPAPAKKADEPTPAAKK